MSAWLRLYPRAWRERYGDEMAEMIASEPNTFRLCLDLLAGAIDAHLNPQWKAEPQPQPDPVAPMEGATKSMSTLTSCFRSCGRTTYSSQAQRKSAFLMLATSLTVVAIYLPLTKFLGKSPATEALLFSAFNIALVVSSLPTFLSNYRLPVRLTLLALGIAASYGFFFLVVLLADRI